MEPATESRRAGPICALAAGLQSGMLGACGMLVWFGLSSEWQRRSFWTAENLMATAFYGDAAIRSGFAFRTLSGAAVYLLLYSSLGALFALLVRDRLPRLRVFLLSLLFSLSWYYLSFGLLWKTWLPLVALLHAPQPTAAGHLLYGALLGRYPAYLPRPAIEVPVTTAVESPLEVRE